MLRVVTVFLLMIVVTSGCVSRKKYNSQLEQYSKLKADFDTTESNLQKCLADKSRQVEDFQKLQQELENVKANSTSMLKQLSDMSVVSASQAESIRKSLEAIQSKDAFIKDLQSAMARKDSLNMALVLNLKGALKDVNDEDVNIKVEGSAVFINISDKMLFRSGSYQITPRAREVLGKVAQVINQQSGSQFMVEGHTDNKPIATASIRDNWDLSVMRSAAVVRALQKDFGIDPSRMIAAGRSEYIPVDSNTTAEGRSKNRRTRIVFLPQLDQFFKLMEPRP